MSLTGFSDPDDGKLESLTWQWSKSMDMAEWTDISGAVGDSYTPKVADIDYYLRAMASYSDRRGDGKTAPIVSEEPVEPKTHGQRGAGLYGKEDSNGDDTDETGDADGNSSGSVPEDDKGEHEGQGRWRVR